MEIENAATLLEMLTRPINLFGGAGFSVLARNRHGLTLPDSQLLASELRSEFGKDHLVNLDLARLCTIIGATDGDRLREYLIERFTVNDFDVRYKYLERIVLGSVFTTNIDNLFHKIFEQSHKYYIQDVDMNGPVYRDRRSIELFMLHGCVLNDSRPFRFGTLEIASSFGTDPDRWRYLQVLLKRNPTIFWGCSLNDAATLEALTQSSVPRGSASDTWILLHPDSAVPEAVSYFRALNLRIIVADTGEFLEYLEANAPRKSRSEEARTDRRTAALFPHEAVPVPGQVPSRPITDFFRGAAPVWSDIFSGILFRNSYYQQIRDSVYSRNNLILTGVPANGKTTMLMQLAAEIDFPGHKLIMDSPSKAKSQLICRMLGSDSALVFVDNFANDWESLGEFLNHSNIVVVAADRDYSVSSVIHRIPREECSFLDITELTDQDLYGYRASIPESIRTPGFSRPEVSHAVRPSLFEFVQANVSGPTLRERFEEALRTFRTESPKLAELLLFVACVHFCRTPVSMDMALAYFHESLKHYSDIYDMAHKIGAIITDYEGDLAEEPQDYFAARSILVAECVIAAADDGSLRRMLLKFHEDVSPYRICHYNVFGRRAYDSQLIGRAFSSWEEGAEFYERIYDRDRNPFILQQKALFLAFRGKYSEAFAAIDRALAQSGQPIWTIQNSHAIILFRANINFAAEPAARNQLDRSMDILKRCYNSDRRKGFHAMTFAHQALDYWDAYRDARAREYLEYANMWLDDQKRNEPWLERIDILKGLVRRRLFQA